MLKIVNKSRCLHSFQQFQVGSFQTSQFIFAKMDPYKVLGVEKSATKEEIRKKFHEKAKKYHPDVNKSPDAKEKFSELNSAYQLLTDDSKRRMYEATGDADAASGGQGQGFDPRQAEEIFNQFFGKGGFGGFGGFQQGGGRPGGRSGGNPFTGHDFDEGEEQQEQQERVEKRRGFNTHKPLEVTFKDACFGTTKDVSVHVAEKCKLCSGTQFSSKRTTCTTCSGKGRITQNIGSGFAKIQRPCGECHGTGSIKQKCSSCSGQGYTQQYKTYETTIPPGTLDGTTLRMRGLGEPGTGGGENGDLILDIKVKPDAKFSAIKEEKNGVKSTLDISLSNAILGGSAKVVNPDETTTAISIHPGTQNGEFITIPGKGMAKSGNHKVYFNVKIPKNLNSKQQEVIRNFASSLHESEN